MIKKLLLAGLLCGTLSVQAQNKAEDVKSFTLKNGMKIMVLEDHSIPNANMYLFWRVGSRNEVHGITGLSHFFEHMMFNGSKKYGPKMFDRVMEANGGSNNAYTTENVTVYTDWFQGKALETIFDLEADRIGHLNIDSAMVESERGVVLSERSTGLENNNFNMLSEALNSVAFTEHPYMIPVIGYESDIKSWTKKDLERYFRTYYAPNNCTVVISGDVTLAEVKQLAAKYLEPIPANTPPPALRTVEPPQNGERRLLVHKDVSSPNVLLAYHVPETRNADYYALDLLNSILSAGNSSRLNKSLVFDKELATELFTYMPESFDPTLFFVYGVVADGVAPDTLEKAMLGEIEKIKKNGITADELQKVKNQKLVAFYHQLETINGKANNLGTYEVFFGDYKKMFDAPALYQKVTKEDIQRVAKKYFTKNNRTVGYLLPETPADKE
ncbi:Predicted Zn-dependent peptidase [Flexibacter flexilis DSM 6793]|uniref:Predicted Zn-dependent peptidase n=1 Tax=Flexibacter flexilis DSM 6793 TaxID=927664 RepID=A0A1I1MVU1_9BACT|nr:pitrilysin family protein [Flexibacter flexilis]SFC89012.1 Predicted Zn-dependent peptidase [Flexibacter flexilis DSM 6793]